MEPQEALDGALCDTRSAAMGDDDIFAEWKGHDATQTEDSPQCHIATTRSDQRIKWSEHWAILACWCLDDAHMRIRALSQRNRVT